MTRTLYSSNIPYREKGTAALSENGMAENKVDYEELLKDQKNPEVLIVDVREPSEIQETGKLPGSINVPMNNLQELVNLSDDEFLNKYGKSKPSKETKIVFSCRSGMRAKRAKESLQGLGYTQAHFYLGSWMEWAEKQEQKKK
ncbi:PREDICTED: heat shock protein 67B2-like isoform X2 [Wasmannia auropunctata]|uniref:heat shock protein 67B2-like isoform X2 n=1 Tax=Wasmannia auropunctata TaxID=64793 RepID=UPI0005F097B9|nr:PREDICTED: heat shock protein 67B2-like isoform X2 [Wasmannia auropunctata]